MYRISGYIVAQCGGDFIGNGAASGDCEACRKLSEVAPAGHALSVHLRVFGVFSESATDHGIRLTRRVVSITWHRTVALTLHALLFLIPLVSSFFTPVIQ